MPQTVKVTAVITPYYTITVGILDVYDTFESFFET